MTSINNQKDNIDMGLYDRQVRTFGKDASTKITNSTIYLYLLLIDCNSLAKATTTDIAIIKYIIKYNISIYLFIVIG